MVMLMQAYMLLMRGLLNFQSFEAIVRYGVPAHDAGDIRTLRRLTTVCRRVDRRASLAATAPALIAGPVVGPLMGMDTYHVILMSGYSLALLPTCHSSQTSRVGTECFSTCRSRRAPEP